MLQAVISSGITVFAVTTFVKLINFLKEIYIAYAFGLSEMIDIYLVALVLISMPMTILINAAQSVCITILTGLSKEIERRKVFFSNVVIILLVVLVFSAFLWLPIVYFNASSFLPDYSADKLSIFKSVLPYFVVYYILTGINLIFQGLLQSERRFFNSSIVTAITPVVGLIVLLAGNDRDLLLLLIQALLLGSIAETICLLVLSIKSGVLPSSFDFRKIINPDVKNFFSFLLKMLPSAFLIALVPVIDQLIASSFGAGSNAALAFGNKLPNAIQGLLVSTIAIVTLPFFSMLHAVKSNEINQSLNLTTSLAFFMGCLIAIPTIYFSEEIVVLLFARGSFTSDDVSIVYPIQSAFILSLPFSMAATVLLKYLAARYQVWRLLAVNFIYLIVYYISAVSLSNLYGLPGLATALLISNASVLVVFISVASYNKKSLKRYGEYK